MVSQNPLVSPHVIERATSLLRRARYQFQQVVSGSSRMDMFADSGAVGGFPATPASIGLAT